jgi:hypothetical protein
MPSLLGLAPLLAAQSLFLGASRSIYKNDVRMPADSSEQGTAMLAYHN